MKHIYIMLCLIFVLFTSNTSYAEITYIHTDTLGNPIAESDENGNITSRSHYKPFGETLEAQKEGIGYTGHLNDTDLGLTYMQARYYDPVIGRFYSNDPIDAVSHLSNEEGIRGFNRYSYAVNNPYKYTDPDGKAVFLAPLVPPTIAALGKAAAFVGSAAAAAWAGSEAINAYNESSVEDLNPLHDGDTLGDTSDISGLSDDDLLDSVNNPSDSDDPGIVVNTKTGKLMNGNTRATELKNRSNDPNSKIEPGTKVKVEEYTPDDSMFID